MLILKKWPVKLFLSLNMMKNCKFGGRFNALNAGLVAAIATELKIPKDIIMESLADFKAVEGRMNVYKINNASIFCR